MNPKSFSYSFALIMLLTLGSAQGEAADPAGFSFIQRNNVTTNVFITSETKTVSGTAGDSWTVSVSSGNSAQYRIGSGSFTSTGGTIAAGQTLIVRHLSSSAPNATVITTVTVGGYNTPFTTVTGSLDRTPDAFGFGAKGPVDPDQDIASETITPTGFNTAIPIQPGPNAKYSVNGASYTNAAGTLQPGQTLSLQHRSSIKKLEYTKTYLKLGGVIGYFTTRTQGSVSGAAYPLPLPTLSVADAAFTEGAASGKVQVSVTLSAASNQAVTVQYTTQPGAAVAGADYTTTSGALTFQAGETVKEIAIAITDDPAVETVETFRLLLSNAVNATLADAEAVITLTDNDIPPLTQAGFATRSITPAGTPPAEWAQFFTPQPRTGIWGEPFTDTDGDGCYDAASGGNPTTFPPSLPTDAEAHSDQTWNSDAANLTSVRGVKIYGDGQSSGKWDGIWAGAGFGSQCAEGVLDDVWARALVIEAGGKTVALVSIDVVGFFNYEITRIRSELLARYPAMRVDEFAVSSTHTHEASDTMGYWGEQLGVDGKFPAYQAYIRSQVIDAIRAAWLAREPAVARFAQPRITQINTHHNDPADTLTRVDVRDSRPPLVKDADLDVGQFARPDGKVIGTIVVWGNHPESLAGDNGRLSSDYATPLRDQLEQEFGGTAIYFTGSVGGLMTPLGVDVPGFGTNATVPRMNEIGRLVAQEAITAIKAEAYGNIGTLSHGRRSFYMEADNTALSALNRAGVFDLPTYNGGESWGRDPAGHTDGAPAGNQGSQFKTEMVAITYGPTVFVTVPGELFPELEYGGFGRSDCATPDTTGRPHEPPIRAQFSQARQVFVLGLGMDELGYIVPGYDFYYGPAPAVEYDDACGEGHYEETVSGSSYMAPWVTCVAAELSGKDPWSGPAAHPACAYGNTHSRQAPPAP